VDQQDVARLQYDSLDVQEIQRRPCVAQAAEVESFAAFQPLANLANQRVNPLQLLRRGLRRQCGDVSPTAFKGGQARQQLQQPAEFQVGQ